MEPNQTGPNPEPSAANPGNVITPGSPPPAGPAGTPPALTGLPTDRPLAVASTGSLSQVSSPVPGSPKKSWKSKLTGKKLLIPIVAVLALLGSSAGAYFGYVMPNKPENVLAKSFSNTLSQHQFTTAGTLNITSSGVSGKLEYTAAVDEDSHYTDTKLNTTISGVNIPLEIITAKGNAYFKVGDLGSIQGLLSPYLGTDPSLKTMEDQIIKNVSNQWYTVDSTLIKEAKLSCLSDWPAAFTPADINSLKTAYQNSQFAKITAHSSDSVNNQPAIKYDISINV
jgi:hypothetical protein